MARNEHIEGNVAIRTICDTLGYSRAHVAKFLRQNARKLKAKRRDGRWTMPLSSIELLREIVVRESGPRYKLGETGPHVR